MSSHSGKNLVTLAMRKPNIYIFMFSLTHPSVNIFVVQLVDFALQCAYIGRLFKNGRGYRKRRGKIDMDSSRAAATLIGGEELFRLKSGELIAIQWLTGTPKAWHNDERAGSPEWHVHSASPSQVLALRVLG